MAVRKFSFAEGEFYHVYNRGTDKRDIFLDEEDFARFLEGMREFNDLEPIGSLFEQSIRKHQEPSFGSKASKQELVHIVAYCLNQNHYHFLLKSVSEKGIEKFMQRLGTGYTKYFNHRYARTGNLFQGKFKAIHIQTNEYLLHVSAYVNLNHQVHQLGSKASKSSWDEYMRRSSDQLSVPDEVLGQFSSASEYQTFAEAALQGILARRGKLDPALLLE